MVRRAKTLRSRRSAARADRASFRQRYDEVERRRIEMLQRLAKLDGKARTHAAFKQASSLMNQRFRKASLAQRAPILSAAEWAIDLLETLRARV